MLKLIKKIWIACQYADFKGYWEEQYILEKIFIALVLVTSVTWLVGGILAYFYFLLFVSYTMKEWLLATGVLLFTFFMGVGINLIGWKIRMYGRHHYAALSQMNTIKGALIRGFISGTNYYFSPLESFDKVVELFEQEEACRDELDVDQLTLHDIRYLAKVATTHTEFWRWVDALINKEHSRHMPVWIEAGCPELESIDQIRQALKNYSLKNSPVDLEETTIYL